ncbi:MAG: hypothetical protein PUC50_08350 [Bacteroidales bacterium]|nr:hypothetical protein [Bacteroidales bacterium]
MNRVLLIIIVLLGIFTSRAKAYQVFVKDSDQQYLTLENGKEYTTGKTVSFKILQDVPEKTGYTIGILAVKKTTQETIEVTKKTNYSFVMPEDDVDVSIIYTPTIYTIKTDEYVKCNIETATIENNHIPFTVTNRENEGYELTAVKIGTTKLECQQYSGYFSMADFLKNVTLKSTYALIKYDITTDDNITCKKKSATAQETVSFTIKNKTGCTIKCVKINDMPISFENNQASFAMSDYKCKVHITAEYEEAKYTITTDNQTTSNLTEASLNDLIKIYASDLTSSGYELDKILVNGKSITFYKYFCNFLMSDYKSDVEITTQYKPISYKIITGKYVNCEQNSATANDIVNFTVDNLSEDEIFLEKVLVNGKQVEIKDFAGSVKMSDYISDITIEAVYSKYHSIKTANNITEISHSTAQKDEQIQFKINRANAGYEPFVYVNSRRLFSPDSINYTFSMFDNDVDIYVDYQEIVVEEPETQEDNQDESEPEVIKKNRQKAINKIKVYPSLAKEGEIITISLENVDSEYFANSKIIIFDILGKSIKTIDNPQEISKIIMPKGLYKGVFISGDKKIRFDFAILK